MVQYGDSTVYFSRLGDRHLRYPGKLRSPAPGHGGAHGAHGGALVHGGRVVVVLRVPGPRAPWEGRVTGGRGECRVPPYTRESISLSFSVMHMGTSAKAWCLLINAEVSLSLEGQ